MPAFHPVFHRLVALLGALLLVPLVAVLGAAPAQADAHVLRGTVLEAPDQPLAGVTVQLLDSTSTPTPTPVGTPATSGVDGTFSLSVDEGSYLVQFSKDGYDPETYSNDAVIVVDADGNASAPVVNNQLDPVTLSITPTYAVTGSVVDDHAAALGDILVEVFDTDDTTVAASGPSATNGSFSVTSAALTAGTYHVRLSDPAHHFRTQWYGGSTPTDVTITDADVSLGTIALTPASASTTHPVTGTVTDANGDPIDGVTVTAVPQSGTDLANQADTTSAANGHYQLMVKAGTYRVTYGATDFTTATYPGDAPAVDVTVLPDGTVQVGTGTATVTVTSLDAVSLVDAVGDAAISGRAVSSADAAGLGGITVDVFPAGADTAESRVATTTTSTTGTVGAWSVGGLKIGTYDIVFSGSSAGTPYDTTSYGGATATPVQVGQGNIITVDDSTKAGGALGDTSLAPASDTSRYAVAGEVDDVNGDPLNGITVTAIPVLGTAGANQKSTVTGADTAPTPLGDAGIYRIGLKAGKYNLQLSGTGYPTTTLRNTDDTANAVVEVVLGNTVKVDGTTAPGGVLDAINLAGTARWPVTGKVVKSGGTAVAGITVQAIPDGESAPVASATTASNGTYSLSLLVGTYSLKYVDAVSDATTYVTTFYGGTPPKLVMVATGGAVTVDDVAKSPLDDVTMAVATSDATYPLKGTVYDQNFDPLDGVTVTAVPVGSTASGNQVSGVSGADNDAGGPLGDAGVYKLLVKPGIYQLRYERSGFQTTMLRSFEDDTVPVTLTVGLNGDVTASPALDLVDGIIDDVQLLLPSAAFKVTPKLSGVVAVGQTVQTTLGTLQGASIDNDYVTISWFLDGEPADDFSTGSIFQKFKVPASAAGRKLSYTVAVDDPDGFRATSVYTSPAFPVPYLATVKAAAKKGILTLTLSAKGAPAPVGTIVLKEGKKTVGKAKLTAKSKGKAVIKLTKLKKGKHKLVVVFSGGGGYGPSQTTISVKV